MTIAQKATYATTASALAVRRIVQENALVVMMDAEAIAISPVCMANGAIQEPVRVVRRMSFVDLLVKSVRIRMSMVTTVGNQQEVTIVPVMMMVLA